MNLIVCLWLGLICLGCAQSEADRTDTRAKESSESESSDYQLKEIEMADNEVEDVNKKVSSVSDVFASVYSQMGAQEEAVHEIINQIAKEKHTVTCGDHDYNMQNYKKLSAALKKAAGGTDASAEFYSVTLEGSLSYYLLEFEAGNLVVTYAKTVMNEREELSISYLEKVQVYAWEYTKKGWLIWEKALSRNQEMDMHMFYRVQPLDQNCREMNQRFVTPISYFCNNLFLTDWDVNSMEKIVFNDLFEFLYHMKYGQSLDSEQYIGGIPKQEFEGLIQEYFEVSVQEIEAIAQYDATNGVYPWEPISAWNRSKQFQPFPEVVEYREDADGTVTLYVEAILVEDGLDRAFRHEVQMKKRESGEWVYIGNKIDREHSPSIPQYKPRKEAIALVDE